MKKKLKIKRSNKVEPILSDLLKEEIIRFMEYHPARRFSKNLRNLLLEFLQHDGAIEAINLNDLLYDLEGLFELLDIIEAEKKFYNFSIPD